MLSRNAFSPHSSSVPQSRHRRYLCAQPEVYRTSPVHVDIVLYTFLKIIPPPPPPPHFKYSFFCIFLFLPLQSAVLAPLFTLISACRFSIALYIVREECSIPVADTQSLNVHHVADTSF